jgi:hypothetical protein
MAQVVEHLPSKVKALGLITSNTHTDTKEKNIMKVKDKGRTLILRSSVFTKRDSKELNFNLSLSLSISTEECYMRTQGESSCQ